MVNKDKLSSIFLFALLTVFSGSCGGGSSPSELESTNNSWAGNIFLNEESFYKNYNPQTKKISDTGFEGNEVNTNAVANRTVVNYRQSSNGKRESLISFYKGTNKNSKLSEFYYSPSLHAPQLSRNGKYLLAEIENEENMGPNTLAVFSVDGNLVWSKEWKSYEQNYQSRSYTWLTGDAFIFFQDKSLYKVEPIKNSVTKIVDLEKLPSEGYSKDIAVSPDGNRIVFTWLSKIQGGLTFWITSLDGKDLRPLTSVAQSEREKFAKTHGNNELPAHEYPIWSPDGKWIGGVILNTSRLTYLPVNSDGNEAYGDMGVYAPIQTSSCNIPFIIPVDGPIQELDRYKMKKNIVPMEKKSSGEMPISICNGHMEWMP
jgi:hypothetical protein